MEKAKVSLSLQCPEHEAAVGMLDINPNAERIGYCYECIAEKGGDAADLKTIPAFLKESSSFYEICRQRVHSAGEIPAEYLEELLKKGERLEKFSKHIDAEKTKVVERFEEMRKAVVQIIDQKEKECIEFLDKETSALSEAYRDYEKLLMMAWPKPSDIQNLYPETDALKNRLSQIDSMDQLQAFMTGIQEDIRMEDFYFKEDDGSYLGVRKRLDILVGSLNTAEGSLPKIQDFGNLENLVKDLMTKELNQQGVQVENSICAKQKVFAYESQIITNEQFETLRNWLPKECKFDLKLLFRSSTDGMSPEVFHQKCDNQGATITLIKCRFKDAEVSSILGGFIDQSWNSNNLCYSSSKEAFLFSLKEQNHSSVKCPILEPQGERAFFGDAGCGPRFGGGHDLHVNNEFMNGGISPCSYSNVSALRERNEYSFQVEDVEVFQVR